MKFLILILTILNIGTASAASPTLFSNQQFLSASSNGKAVVVGFHSSSCGSCKVRKPNLEAILNEPGFSSVTGLMADFDEVSAFRKSLPRPVRTPSTIVIFKSGKEVARIQGITDKDELRNLLVSAITKN